MCCVMPPASRVDHVGRAERVEQRGLAVVDVAHHGDHRRARHLQAAGPLRLTPRSCSASLGSGVLLGLFLEGDDLGRRSRTPWPRRWPRSGSSGWLIVASTPAAISLAMTSLDLRFSFSASSLTVTPSDSVICSGTGGRSCFGLATAAGDGLPRLVLLAPFLAARARLGERPGRRARHRASGNPRNAGRCVGASRLLARQHRRRRDSPRREDPGLANSGDRRRGAGSGASGAAWPPPAGRVGHRSPAQPASWRREPAAGSARRGPPAVSAGSAASGGSSAGAASGCSSSPRRRRPPGRRLAAASSSISACCRSCSSTSRFFSASSAIGHPLAHQVRRVHVEDAEVDLTS